MESNKDEADRCLEVAEKYISKGKPKEAQKFIEKSQILYPSKRAQDFLELVRNLPANEFSAAEVENENNEFQNILSNKKHRRCRSLTPPIDDIIHKITNSRNYYEVLGVRKRTSGKEIKHSFKKLALLLHPDKTQRPGATDAFRAIRNAVGTLTDPQRRKLYDLYVHDSSSSASVYTNSQWDSSGNSSSSNSTTVEQKTFKKSGTTEWCRLQYFIFQLLPMLLVIALIVTYYYSNDPIYSLRRTPKHPVLRYTQNLKVPYYVKANYLNENSGLTISQLDNEVEIETITSLQYACYNEKNYRKSLLRAARKKNDSRKLDSLIHLRLPSCDSFLKLRTALYILKFSHSSHVS